jgi:hypothetical protein
VSYTFCLQTTCQTAHQLSSHVQCTLANPCHQSPCSSSLQDDDKSLHKCHQEEKKFDRLRGPLLDAERPTGFCSSITVGSMLPFKTAIMKGSVVELLARRGRLEILVQNPPDGQELYWHNTRTVPKPYKGPREVRFEQDFSPHHDVKLALTSWAHGAFDVLHPAPGSRLLGKSMQRAWERPVDPWHEGSSSEDDEDAGRSRGAARHLRSLQGSPLQLQEQQQNAAAEPADAEAVGEAALQEQQHQQQQQARQQQRQLRQQMLLQLMQQRQQQQQPAAPSAPEAGAGSSSAPEAGAGSSSAAAAGAGSSSAAAVGTAAAGGATPAAAAEAGASHASEESANSRDGQLMA